MNALLHMLNTIDVYERYETTMGNELEFDGEY